MLSKMAILPILLAVLGACYASDNSSYSLEETLKNLQMDLKLVINSKGGIPSDLMGLDRGQEPLSKRDFGGVDLKREAASIMDKLRALARDEMGVTLMQVSFIKSLVL